ncbi:ATP-binding protein [Streptomyces sp. NPDC048290]|uniref:AAA family ATPase n=1 Tax=Streptomyces sp. NPDC048290 TaxID=3155811 RepID=UPI003426E774
MAHRIGSLPVTSPRSESAPSCVLLAGLPGSGKTTLSRALAARGFVRLCPDEEMFRRHGVYGIDFPRGIFPKLEIPVLEETSKELRGNLEEGCSVVVDHGFWTPADRTKWRSIAIDSGANALLVYLEVDHDELWTRVSKRNAQHEADPNSIYFAESDLVRYRNRFVPPGVDEPHLVYDGDPDSVLRALKQG